MNDPTEPVRPAQRSVAAGRAENAAEARRYIETARRAGHREAEIVRALREAGWTEDEAKALLQPPATKPEPAAQPVGAGRTAARVVLWVAFTVALSWWLTALSKHLDFYEGFWPVLLGFCVPAGVLTLLLVSAVAFGGRYRVWWIILLGGIAVSGLPLALGSPSLRIIPEVWHYWARVLPAGLPPLVLTAGGLLWLYRGQTPPGVVVALTMALGGVAIGIIAPAIMIPAERQRSELVCYNHLRELGRAMLTYAEENGGRLPPAEDWPVRLLPYVGDPAVFLCPADRRRDKQRAGGIETSYTFNLYAETSSVESLRDLNAAPVLFEGTAVCGREEALARSRHGDGLNVAWLEYGRFMPDKYLTPKVLIGLRNLLSSEHRGRW